MRRNEVDPRNLSQALEGEDRFTERGSSGQNTTRALSQASTRPSGPIRVIQAMIGEEKKAIPILRCLREDPQASVAVCRKWYQYDPMETDEALPAFSFRQLQAVLAKGSFPLPQISGRWRLEEVTDYPGFSYYTILAMPVETVHESGPETQQRIACIIVALQSNDSEEGNYVRIGVGRGMLTRGGTDSHAPNSSTGWVVSLTLSMIRIRFEQKSLGSLEI